MTFVTTAEERVRTIVLYPGKTTWLTPIQEVMNPKHVASITAESTFGAQMIDARTELLFIDEWAADKNSLTSVKWCSKVAVR